VCLSGAVVRGSVYVYVYLCVSTSVWQTSVRLSLSLFVWVSLCLFFCLLPPACYFHRFRGVSVLFSHFIFIGRGKSAFVQFWDRAEVRNDSHFRRNVLKRSRF